MALHISLLKIPPTPPSLLYEEGHPPGGNIWVGQRSDGLICDCLQYWGTNILVGESQYFCDGGQIFMGGGDKVHTLPYLISLLMLNPPIPLSSYGYLFYFFDIHFFL